MNQNPRKNRTRPIEKGVVRYVDHSMAISMQINIILQKLDKNQSFLALELGKRESEISKWLRGTHNFTLKTISKIEDVLGEPIIVCPKDIKATEEYTFIFNGYQKISLKEKPSQTTIVAERLYTQLLSSESDTFTPDMCLS